jgi:hypothetical protein
LAAPVSGQPSASDWGTGFQSVSDVLEMPDGSLWYCRQAAGGSGSGEIRRIAWTSPTGVSSALPAGLDLTTPRPNPSSGNVGLAWSQPSRQSVQLSIYDLNGRRVRTIEDGTPFDAGTHERRWDGRTDSGAQAGRGVYFVRLRVGGAMRESRIVVIR